MAQFDRKEVKEIICITLHLLCKLKKGILKLWQKRRENRITKWKNESRFLKNCISYSRNGWKNIVVERWSTWDLKSFDRNLESVGQKERWKRWVEQSYDP